MPYHIAYSTSNKAQRANTAINSLIQDGGRTGQRPTERRTQSTAPCTTPLSTAEYSGYFAVVKATDTTVAIIDGAAPVSSTCGYYEHGIQRVAVTKPEAITVTGNGVIYVTITYTTAYVFTFAFASSLPASANGSIVRKLADVTFADSKITTITQAHDGVLITPGVL